MFSWSHVATDSLDKIFLVNIYIPFVGYVSKKKNENKTKGTKKLQIRGDE